MFPRAKGQSKFSHWYHLIFNFYLDMNVTFVSHDGSDQMGGIKRCVLVFKGEMWKGSSLSNSIEFYSNLLGLSPLVSALHSRFETKRERPNKGLANGNKSWLFFFFLICSIICCWYWLFFPPFAISVQKIYFYICNKFVIKILWKCVPGLWLIYRDT